LQSGDIAITFPKQSAFSRWRTDRTEHRPDENPTLRSSHGILAHAFFWLRARLATSFYHTAGIIVDLRLSQLHCHLIPARWLL
jgi:hypothetical protein